MSSSVEGFQQRVGAVMERFARQNETEFAREAVARFARRLWRLIDERGLPPGLEKGETGAPGEVDKSEIRELTRRATKGNEEGEMFEDAAKQIVKACFYPEFRVCRDSYREQSSRGVCKRQVLDKARERVSGAHCVDCPYWTDVSLARHVELLADGWCGAPEELRENRGVFLPEDFRELRRWVRQVAARRRPK